MFASSSSLECGKRLRAERERLCLSLRDVQDLSRGLAEQRKNHEYYIAHASLADIEKGKLAPSIYKLYSLCAIYGRRYEQLATIFGVPTNEAEEDHRALPLPRTYLIGGTHEGAQPSITWPPDLREKLRSERTNLVSKMFASWKQAPVTLLQQMDWRNSLYGYVGMEDYTLYPFIRPGSFVLIDSHQRRVPPMRWHSDFDRPIYFFELRDRYVCSWCELHGSQLILVPTAQSRGQARHFRYPGDATIVGRVTAVTMRIAEAL
jgi:transcriptional regulator with XRE-family HTH domain